MDNKTIIETIKELFKNMNMHLESVEAASSGDESHPRFIVKSNDSGVLIGARGENLSAFTTIARRLVAKKLPVGAEPVKFFIDINGYLESGVKDLEARAKVMAERARSLKTNIELEPMGAYQRMIVHSTLGSFGDIKTESSGFGKDRKVVIKYVEKTDFNEKI